MASISVHLSHHLQSRHWPSYLCVPWYEPLLTEQTLTVLPLCPMPWATTYRADTDHLTYVSHGMSHYVQSKHWPSYLCVPCHEPLLTEQTLTILPLYPMAWATTYRTDTDRLPSVSHAMSHYLQSRHWLSYLCVPCHEPPLTEQTMTVLPLCPMPFTQPFTMVQYCHNNIIAAYHIGHAIHDMGLFSSRGHIHHISHMD